MRKFILISLFLGFCIYSYGQITSIKDQVTGEPLELATIASESPRTFSTTNAEGQFNVSPFKQSQKIEIRLLGYKTILTNYSEIEKANFQVLMAPSSIIMDEYVVSANRWTQSSQDVPEKVTIISNKEVSLQNPQTAADLLGSSGEVFIQKSQQGGGSPMIRGFSTNRLLYSVDGVRMNTAIFRSGNLQNVISLDPFAIEKTEVFFGPGSVIYGSDAIGGVMSFQTIKPQLSLSDKPLIKGKASTRFSSANNEKTGHFHVNVGGEKWASITSISYYNFGDLQMGSHGPDDYLSKRYVQRQDSTDVVMTNPNPKVQIPSGYSQFNIMEKILFKPNEKWDFQYGFHYSETSDYSRYDRLLRDKKGLPRYGEWSYGPQKWMMNNLSITHHGNNKLYEELTIRLAHQYFEESRMDRDFNKNDRHIRIEKVNAYSANFDFHKPIGKKHELFYGIETVFDDVNSSGIDEDISTGIEISGPARYPNSTWASYAAYVSYQLKLSEKFIIQSGLRYNMYQLDAIFDTSFYHFPYTTANISNGALTGSLGFVYKPEESWIIRANASTGFRSPNVDDMGKVFDSEPGAVVVPNPDLHAEYAYNAELGLAKIFGDVIKIDLTGYYTILQNAMVRRDFTLNGMDSIMYDGTLSQVQAVQNAAVAHVYGIQAGLDIKLPFGFGISSVYNYQVGEEELDDGSTSPSRHAPPWFGVTRLTFLAHKLNMQLYAVYSGEKKYEDLPVEEQGKTEIYAKDAEGNPYAPGWYTLNFKATYPISHDLLVSAGLENITDQRYRPYSSGISAAGRNFILSVTASF